MGGSIDANLGRLRLDSGAVIGGDVVHASEREAEIADGAQVCGDVQRRDPEWAGYQSLLTDNVLTGLIGAFLGLLMLGWGLMLARPGWMLHADAALHARPDPRTARSAPAAVEADGRGVESGLLGRPALLTALPFPVLAILDQRVDQAHLRREPIPRRAGASIRRRR